MLSPPAFTHVRGRKVANKGLTVWFLYLIVAKLLHWSQEKEKKSLIMLDFEI